MSLLKIQIATIIFLLSFAESFSQDSTVSKAEIDPSKPTNLYTQVNTTLEFQNQKTQNLFGVRFNIQYAVNPDNLFLIEIPMLYNDRTSKFGFSDMRVRYFNVIKRNISKSFIAIAPFLDVTAPIGSYEKGLGSSSWSLAAGTVLGFVASKKLSLFPGISYVYVTKPTSKLIPESVRISSSGFGLQCNTSYRFDRKTFIAISPNPTFLFINDKWVSNWPVDFSFNKIVTPNKLKLNAGCNSNFSSGAFTLKMGATFYL